MTRLKNLLLIMALSVSGFVMSQNNVPAPNLLPPGGGGTPGPGLPIDTNILVLIVVAVIFGSITAVRKYKKN